ncbi:putative cytokinetic ring protein SteA [Nocardioides sp. GCM10027113]|uniref:putative cytokinetic ring protein SteA n=1 Tax=unclassified Nocardioides TaxID=2615069 RepID=UPI0036143D41
MKSLARTKQRDVLPGVRGTARRASRTRDLLPRLQPGDVAVLDHLDLDRTTARRLVDAGVVAVLNARPMISGRYPNLGPEVLDAAGLLVLDRVEGLDGVHDGASVRLHDEVVFVGETAVAMGRQLDAEIIGRELEEARVGLTTQLETFTHNTTAFLRREQDLLLHGLGLPQLSTPVAGRPVVVVVAGHDHREELAALAAFVREQRPVLMGVDAGADALLAAGLRPDVVVLSDAAEEHDRPSAKALRAARDVVVRVERGHRMHREQLERLGVRPVAVESSASTEDAALLLADAGDAEVLIGVGMHATLDDFLDRRRPGLAGTYLTRLKVGHRLVDARAVPTLYSGRVRPRHLLGVTLAGLVAVGAAVGVTPVGQEWGADGLQGALDLAADLTDHIRGLFR